MVRSFPALALGCLLLIATFALTTVRGEQSFPQDSSALLNEVRLLRRAIEMLAGSNARVQIVFGRLQLQEQRTTAAVRRLDEARATLAKATQMAGASAERIKDVEEMLADARLPENQVKGLTIELQSAKRESAALEAERVRLATAESEASAVLAQEQARWSDLNRQLEELERALAPRPQ